MQVSKKISTPHPILYIPALLFLLSILTAGCAGLADRARMNKFSEMATSYQRALEMSDYRLATKYVDSKGQTPATGARHYDNIKIVRYEVTGIDVSDDRLTIEQDVELQYFLLDNNRMKILNDHQVWKYKEQDKAWMLQTGLPKFYQKK